MADYGNFFKTFIEDKTGPGRELWIRIFSTEILKGRNKGRTIEEAIPLIIREQLRQAPAPGPRGYVLSPRKASPILGISLLGTPGATKLREGHLKLLLDRVINPLILKISLGASAHPAPAAEPESEFFPEGHYLYKDPHNPHSALEGTTWLCTDKRQVGPDAREAFMKCINVDLAPDDLWKRVNVHTAGDIIKFNQDNLGLFYGKWNKVKKVIEWRMKEQPTYRGEWIYSGPIVSDEPEPEEPEPEEPEPESIEYPDPEMESALLASHLSRLQREHNDTLRQEYDDTQLAEAIATSTQPDPFPVGDYYMFGNRKLECTEKRRLDGGQFKMDCVLNNDMGQWSDSDKEHWETMCSLVINGDTITWQTAKNGIFTGTWNSEEKSITWLQRGAQWKWWWRRPEPPIRLVQAVPVSYDPDAPGPILDVLPSEHLFEPSLHSSMEGGSSKKKAKTRRKYKKKIKSSKKSKKTLKQRIKKSHTKRHVKNTKSRKKKTK